MSTTTKAKTTTRKANGKALTASQKKEAAANISKAKKKAKKISLYKPNVLEANAELKQESKTLGGAVKMLKLMSTNKEVQKALSEVAFPTLKKACRKSKAGNYSPFFVLQALYKLELTSSK